MKKYWLLLIILFLLPVNSVFGLYEGYAVDRELLLRFNEQDSGQANTYDSSVNNHSVSEDWKYTDGFSTPSYRSTADSIARFINDSHLVIPHHSTLQTVSLTEYYYFTLGFWVKILSPPQDASIWVVRKRNNYEMYLYNSSATSYETKFRYKAAYYETSWYMYSTTLINLNQWYFVVAQVNTSGYQKLWINGVLDNEQSMGSIVGSDSSYDFKVGNEAGNYSSDILIDDVFFYFNSTFSQAYITWLYANMPYMDSSEIPEETTTTTTTTTTEEEGYPAGKENIYQIVVGNLGFSDIEMVLISSFVAMGSVLGYITYRSFRKGKK